MAIFMALPERAARRFDGDKRRDDSSATPGRYCNAQRVATPAVRCGANGGKRPYVCPRTAGSQAENPLKQPGKTA